MNYVKIQDSFGKIWDNYVYMRLKIMLLDDIN